MAQHWRSAPGHRKVNSLVCPDWLLDRAEGSISADARANGNPQIQAVLAPVVVDLTRSGWSEGKNALLATATLLVWAHGGAFKRATIQTWIRYGFETYAVGLHNNAGPRYDCQARHSSLGYMHFLFMEPSEAEALGHWFAGG